MINEKINTAKSSFDWFLNKKQINQVIVLLVIIIGVLGYFSYEGKKEFKAELSKLKIK